MTLYKLTTQDWYTRKGETNETKWGPGVTHSIDPSNPLELCSPRAIHAYKHPLVALFMNPRDANIKDPLIWESISNGEIKKDTYKVGVYNLTTIKLIEPQPVLTIEHRIRFAIRCSTSVYHESNFNKWANNWLLNIDRTATAASYAAAADAAAYAADAAADAAAYAATAASYAADAAAYAAAYAAYAAAYAANAAAYAADAAAYAAADADAANATKFNLEEIAEWAITTNTNLD